MRIADTTGISLVALSALVTTALITNASWYAADAPRAIVPAPVPPAPPGEPTPRIKRCGVPVEPHQLAIGSDYRDVLVGARGALERCMDLDGSTEVQLRFELTRNGHVRKLHVKGRAHGELTSCLRKVSSKLAFPVNEHPVMISTSLRRH
jgi:hypothetical protein